MGQFNKLMLEKYPNTPLENALEQDPELYDLLVRAGIAATRGGGMRVMPADVNRAAAIDKPRGVQ